MKKVGKILILVAMTLSVILPGQVLKIYADTSRQNAGLRVNTGCMDNLSYSNGNINVRGWHAIDNSSTLANNYGYLFIMDANTDVELARYPMNNESYSNPIWGESRPDVVSHIKGVNGVIVNSYSGFNASVQVKSNMRGKKIYIMHRYTDNSAGNNPGRYADFFYNSTRLYIS